MHGKYKFIYKVPFGTTYFKLIRYLRNFRTSDETIYDRILLCNLYDHKTIYTIVYDRTSRGIKYLATGRTTYIGRIRLIMIAQIISREFIHFRKCQCWSGVSTYESILH